MTSLDSKHRIMNVNDLEIFIYTNGRSSFDFSLKSIECQSVVPKINIVEDMTMIKAINHSLSKCSSKYFMKIDDDFLLHTRAVEFMWSEFLELSNDNTAMMWWHLWENWSRNKIQSIKIYNRDLARKVGFVADGEGRIDITFIGRTRKNGFDMIRRESMVAIHGCSPWQEQLEYLKTWKEQAKSGRHSKIRTGLMRSYNIPLQRQFNDRDNVLYRVNRLYNTDFYKFLTKK